MNFITHIDKFFHNSLGAERYPGTPHFTIFPPKKPCGGHRAF